MSRMESHLVLSTLAAGDTGRHETRFKLDFNGGPGPAVSIASVRLIETLSNTPAFVHNRTIMVHARMKGEKEREKKRRMES